MIEFKSYILEKLHIDKDTKTDFEHEVEDFPFKCIGTEGECYTIGHNGYWRMLNFRKYLMEINKKTRYKDILFTIKRNDKVDFLKLNFFSKLRNRPLVMDFDIKDSSVIEENGYKRLQDKIVGPNILNGGIGLNIGMTITQSDIKYIHISWSDKLKCICINFESQ